MQKSFRTIALAASLYFAPTGAVQASRIHDSWPVVAQERNEEAECDIGVIGNGKFFLVVATGLPANSSAFFQTAVGDMPGTSTSDWPQSAFGRRSEYSVRSNDYRRSEYSRRYPFSNGKVRMIDKTVRTNANGEYRSYVLPFVHDRQGGVVTVAITAGNCHVETSFPWRREIRVID